MSNNTSAIVIGLVPSQSDSSKQYAVTKTDKQWRCECLAFRFGKGKLCKHLTALMAGKTEGVKLTAEGKKMLGAKKASKAEVM